MDQKVLNWNCKISDQADILKILQTPATPSNITLAILQYLENNPKPGLIEALVNCKFESTDPQTDECVLYYVVKLLVRQMKVETVSHDLQLQIIETIFSIVFQLRLSLLLRLECQEMLIKLALNLRDIDVIHELLRFLVQMMDPTDLHHTDSMRQIAMKIMNKLLQSSFKFDDDKELLDLKMAQYLYLALRSALVNQQIPALGTCLSLFTNMLQLHPTYPHLECLIDLLCSYLDDTLPQVLVTPELMGKVLKKYNCSWLDGNEVELDVMKCLTDRDPSVFKGNFKLHSLTSSTTDPRLVVMETLTMILSWSRTVGKIFEKSDCDVKSNNLYEKIVCVVTRLLILPSLVQESQIVMLQSQPHVTRQDRERYERLGDVLMASKYQVTSSLSLEYIIDICATWLDRVSSIEYVHNQHLDELLNQKKLKVLQLKASELFTVSSKKAIAYMVEQNLLVDTSDAQLALMCHQLPLNKKALGEFLAKPANYQVLIEFMKLFKFDSSVAIDDALRLMLERFRLPGEAQQIQRVVEAFSSAYFIQCVRDEVQSWDDNPHDGYEENEGPPWNEDSVFVLAFSIIMLNTDQHNPQVRRRMTAEDFVKNVRGTNTREIKEGDRVTKKSCNFQASFLKQIYQRIRDREIIMPDEHEGEVGYSFIIKEVTSKVQSSHDELSDAKDETYQVALDRHMFKIAWRLFATCIIYTWHTSDQATLQRSIHAYHQLCALAFGYGCKDVLDSLLTSLLKATQFSTKLEYTVASVSELTAADHNWRKNFKLKRQQFLMWFKQNVYCQVACLVAFRNLNEYSDGVKNSWILAFNILCNFYQYGLINIDALTQYHNYKDQALVQLPRLRLIKPLVKKTVEQKEAESSSSFLAALSSFLMSASAAEEPDEVDVVTVEELEAEKNCYEVLDELALDQLLLQQTKSLSLDTLIVYTKSLIKAGNFAQENPTLQQQDTVMFILELLVKVLELNAERITEPIFGSLVQVAFLEDILSRPFVWHHLLFQQAISGCMRIIDALLQAEEYTLSCKVLNKLTIQLAALLPTQIKEDHQMAVNIHAGQCFQDVLGDNVLAGLFQLLGTSLAQNMLLIVLQESIIPVSYLVCIGAEMYNVEQVSGDSTIEEVQKHLETCASSYSWGCLIIILKGFKLFNLSEKVDNLDQHGVNPAALAELVNMLTAFVNAPQHIQSQLQVEKVSASKIASKLQQVETSRPASSSPTLPDPKAAILALANQRSADALKILYQLQ